MKSPGSLLRRHGFDLALILLALEGIYEVTLREAGSETTLGGSWLGALAVVSLVLPLFARRQFPFAAPALVWLLGTAISFVDGELAASSFCMYLSGAAAAYLFGNLGDEARSRIGLGIVIVGSAIVVANNPNHATSEFVTIPATFAIAWLAGSAFRARADRAEQAEIRAAIAERERESAARLAVSEERARITRELHDIVAHAMSVMVLQVGAVRHRLATSLPEDSEALRTVEDTGRAALTEMRRLLGVVQDEDQAELSPQPGLDRLDALIADVGRAGLTVNLDVEGKPVALPRALDLSAYRIVQEGLTNALKHSHAATATVRLRYGPAELEIEVHDGGTGAGPGDGLGRGLVGIRERVKIYGGEMSAGPAPDGGYRLGVTLPIASYPS